MGPRRRRVTTRSTRTKARASGRGGWPRVDTATTERLLRTIVEHAHDGLNVLDLATSRYVFMNPAQVAMTGFTRDELDALSAEQAYERVHPDDRHVSIDQQRRILSGEEPGSLEVEYRWKVQSGEYRWFADTRALVRDPEGRPVALVGVSRDVTARKEAEDARRVAAELAAAHVRKDEFLAMLGHELRNPLAAIRTAAELVRQVAPTDGRAMAAHDALERQTVHMARLVNGLLDVARITHGKVDLDVQQIDLGALVDVVLQDRAGLFAEARLVVERSAPAHAVWVRADRVRLVQVLDNLLSNAVTFTPPGGRIDVSVHQADGEAVIRVRDTGAGFPADVVPYLFEPFQQASGGTLRRAGGLGLGLALARSLVELHGGRIAGHSDCPGAGALFEVVLPLGEAPATGERPHAPATGEGPDTPAGAPALRVLLVEDDPDVGPLLRDLLRVRGHAVTLATCEEEALAALRSSRVDVVACDVGLPGRSGYDLARGLRADAELRHLPLVALTGHGLPADQARTTAAGFDAHLTKPVSARALETVLTALVRRPDG